MNDAKPVRRWRRWLVSIFCGIGLVPILILLLLLTGWPQRQLLQRALETASGRDVRIEGLSTLGGHVKASNIQIVDKDAAEGTPPALRVSGIDLDYAIWPEDSRYLPSIAITSLACRLRTQEMSMIAAQKQPRSSATKSPSAGQWNVLSFLPKTAHIDDITLDIESPAAGFTLGGVTFQSTIDTADAFQIALDGPSVTASYWLNNRETGKILPPSMVSVSVSRNGAITDLRNLTVQIPGILDIAAHANLKEAGVIEWDIALERLIAEQIDLAQVGISFPVSLKRLDASGTRLAGRFNRGDLSLVIPDTKVHIVGDSLALGPRGMEIYEGNIAIDGANASDSDIQFTAQTTLNHGQKLTTSLSGKSIDLVFHTGLDNWSRDDIIAVTPKTFRPKLESFRVLQGLASASVDARIRMLNMEVTAAAKPLLASTDGTAVPAEITVSAKSPAGGSLLNALAPSPSSNAVETTARLRIADAALSFAGTVSAVDGVNGVFTLDRVDPSRWMQLLTGGESLAALKGILSGTLGADVKPDLNTINMKLDIVLDPGGQVPDAAQNGQLFKIVGNLNGGNVPFWHVGAPQLDLTVGDAATVSVKNMEAEFASFSGKTDISGDVDLAIFAPYVPGSDLRGRISFQSPIKHEKGVTTAAVNASIEGFGYGALAAPYATPLEIKGTVSYDNLNREGNGSDCVLSLGSGTTLSMTPCTMTMDPTTFNAPFTLQTDAKPLIDMGWLTSVEGQAGISGTLRYDESGFSGNATINIKAPSLAPARLPVIVDGFAAKGTAQCEPGATWTGSGELAAQKTVILGVTSTALAGPWSVENNVVKATLAGAIYQGTVTADAVVGIPGGALFEVTLALKDLNLETLCQEMGFPSVHLTGLADGTLVLKAGMSGLQDLRLDLSSTRNFSVNRAFLEQIFASQYAGNQVLQMVIEKMGKEPQQPFDSAKMELRLEQERVVGSVVLALEQRTFTVDLGVDMAAVLQGIEWLQENNLKNVQGVSTGAESPSGQ